MGTEHFAPPEQYGFRQTDCRSDLFALGMVMGWMLTGSVRSEDYSIISDKHLRRIIEKCTAFSPEDRFATAAEVKKALQCEGGSSRAPFILFIKVNNNKKKQQDLEWAISNYHSYTGDAQKAIRLFSEVMDTVEGRKLYDMHRAVRDRDFASAAVQFLDYKEEGGRLNPDWWLSTICHAAEKLDDPSAQLTALYDAYVPSLACQTETMDNWFRLWMDRSCACYEVLYYLALCG